MKNIRRIFGKRKKRKFDNYGKKVKKFYFERILKNRLQLIKYKLERKTQNRLKMKVKAFKITSQPSGDKTRREK